MEKALIDKVKEKMKRDGTTNVKELALSLSLKPANFYKWMKGISNPKAEDAEILKNWINGTFSAKEGEISNRTKRSKPELDETTAKYIALLEDHNKELKEKTQASLQTVLDNQLALTSLVEATLKGLSKVLLPGDEPGQVKFRVDLHREAFQRLKVLKQTGNHLVIDSEDIVSAGA